MRSLSILALASLLLVAGCALIYSYGDYEDNAGGTSHPTGTAGTGGTSHPTSTAGAGGTSDTTTSSTAGAGGTSGTTTSGTAGAGGTSGATTSSTSSTSSTAVTAACASGAPAEVFDDSMVGCAATQTFAQRASLCAPGSHVCSAQEWVQHRGGRAPSYHYWTDDILLYYTGTSEACGASATALGTGWYQCTDAGSPMRVCAESADQHDPMGNNCNWIGCGLDGIVPDAYFGGCDGNVNAGALCCMNP